MELITSNVQQTVSVDLEEIPIFVKVPFYKESEPRVLFSRIFVLMFLWIFEAANYMDYRHRFLASYFGRG
jgi:hypothetical protein